MIKIERNWVGGFEGAVRGMRNPHMSHEKSDSGPLKEYTVSIDSMEYKTYCSRCYIDDCWYCPEFAIGDKDMELAKKLIRAGSEHRKFLRMIHVQADVTAPRYWWQEAETYQYLLHDPMNYVRNSSSTMHLITKRPLTIDDFSTNKSTMNFIEHHVLPIINPMICEYSQTKNEELFITIKQILPESYMQMRTIDTNYECLLHVYGQRKNHRLPEWSGSNGFCEWIINLPYMRDFLEGV